MVASKLLVYVPVSIATLLIVRYLLRKYAQRLPPGPKGRFLIGNLLDLPRTDADKAKTYVQWRQDCGHVMHLDMFGAHIIVLNSARAARDLMDKRAGIYSDRPRMAMYVELIGNDWMLTVATGELHKQLRAVAQRYFLAQIKDWQHVQVESARTLVRNVHASPDDWAGLVRLGVASSVLRICYGYDVTCPDDPLLKIAQDAAEVPRNGPYLVNQFPILKYYPSWLPGGRFKKDVEEGKLVSRRLRYTPFNMVRNQMAAGVARPSFISTLLSQLPPDEDLDNSHQAGLIRDAAAAMFAASVDSTVSLMYTFVGAMVLHPDIQRRAQCELDSVLDQDRMPTFADRSSLPFVDCIVFEVLRWNILLPLGMSPITTSSHIEVFMKSAGFPHMVTEEDEYLGYRIPKGSTVLGNTWAILRDPEVFPNPEQFGPCRFLATTQGSAMARETVDATVFGWGRRTCPGRHVGHSALFILISHMLACFDMAKPLNDVGHEVEPVLEFDSQTTVRRALPVPCRMRVRSDKIASLISRLE